MFAFLPLKLIQTYNYFFGLENDFYSTPKLNLELKDIVLITSSYLYSIILIIVCYKFLNYFSSKIHLKLTTFDTENPSKIELVEAKSGKRLVHLILDSIILYSIFYTIFNSLVRYTFFSQFLIDFESMFGQKLSLWIILAFCRIIFFLFFELQFNATPGKFLTKTKVMYFDGTETNYNSLIKRTFSRLVPFDSITFLFGYNLHDNWSSTAVFDEQYAGESDL